MKNISYLLFLLSWSPIYGNAMDLSREQCRQLIIHHKPQGSIAYTPGIDVAGNPVAPADLPESLHFDMGKSVTIDIDLPVKKHAPHSAHHHQKNNHGHHAIRGSSIDAGEVQIEEDGSIWINGEPVHNEALEEIGDYCRSTFPDL